MNETEQPLFMDIHMPEKCPGLPEDFGMGSSVLVIVPSRGRGDTGRIISATVTEKVRVWITVRCDEENRRPREYRLRVDNQTDGSVSHYATQFRTPEQHQWRQASDTARGYLREQGIDLIGASPWRGQEMRLARILWLHAAAPVPTS